MTGKKIAAIIFLILAFVASAGASYTIFSKSTAIQENPLANQKTPNKTTSYDALIFDQNQAKTEPCPINGVMYSKQQRAWWEKHRPLGIMIENSSDARPQSGISIADVTYEAVAEGGITRTLNIFYCQDAGIVGPVRSARTYFLDFVSEYGDYPLYAHVGGANTPGPADALGQINDYGWGNYNDLNQFSIGFPTYWRDETRQGHDVATEHTMYSTTSKLFDVGKSRGLTNVDKNGTSWDTNFTPYAFKDDVAASNRGSIGSIQVDFWNEADYIVNWTYNKQNNEYMRVNGGQPHIDRDTNKQLSAKDVIVLLMKEAHANDGYTGNEHMLYGTKGTGQALIFMDGKEVKGTWRKASRTGRTHLYDSNGTEVVFTRGKLWFEVVGTDSNVTVK